MDDYSRWNHQVHHVPAFGSWDYGDDLPYTQCFESARQAGFDRYGSYAHEQAYGEERDLYVAGDLYQNDIVTPAVIVVPRRRRKEGLGYQNVKERKKQQKMMMMMQKQEQQHWGYSPYDIKQPPSPVLSPPRPYYNSKSKAVDEDLYKIPPEFLHVKPKRKRGLGLFSSCLLPGCV